MFGRLVELYAGSPAGITEFSESFEPRRKMNRNFFPLRPMLPSASARFITNGMSTRVDKATPIPILKLRSKKLRREMILKFSIKFLLFLKALEGQEHGHHAPNPDIVRRRIARHR